MAWPSACGASTHPAGVKVDEGLDASTLSPLKGASDVPTAVMNAAIATSQMTVAINPSFPPILTLNHLAHMTQVPYKHLRDYVTRDVESYKTFRVRKRARPGKPTSFRVICVPRRAWQSLNDGLRSTS